MQIQLYRFDSAEKEKQFAFRLSFHPVSIFPRYVTGDMNLLFPISLGCHIFLIV